MVLSKKEIEKVLEILKQMYPDVKSMLHFNTPFELLVATILSAQCTDVRVNKVTDVMFKEYNTPQDFAKMDIKDIEEYIKTCGLYRNKAKNIKNASIKLVKDFNGKVPDNMKEIMTLPGVGRKTANVVLSNAFGIPGIAVDTHVFRVTNRIGLADAKDVLHTEYQLRENIPKERWSDAHHELIYLGRNICKARKPLCEMCKLAQYCKYYKENK
ncbi:MAG: endonuclease III [Tissierellia bacterium]|nr:endonuclease III [Tissierellia bacterium]